jgi:hypothetical protein
MKINVHHDPITGRIIQVDNSDTPFSRDGSDLLTLDVVNGAFPDCNGHKVDLQSKTIIEIPMVERLQDHDVKSAIWSELNNTDHLMLPDRDDIAPQTLVAWKAYRQALRDLSKGSPAPTPAAMIAAWPVGPDGNDAIPDLRSRLPQG